MAQVERHDKCVIKRALKPTSNRQQQKLQLKIKGRRHLNGIFWLCNNSVVVESSVRVVLFMMQCQNLMSC
jgi:hypothetical protein